MKFYKYQGAGNDFIFIDDRPLSFPIKEVEKMCHRQLGIGADGVILLQPSKSVDFRMRIFNSDGSEAASCGNGLACLMRFLIDLGLEDKTYRIELMKSKVFIKMRGEEPVVCWQEAKDLRLSFPLPLAKETHLMHYINTGVPHVVLFTENLREVEVVTLGKEIRGHPQLQPEGANVNFAEVVKEGKILVRTYERGVENETMACGTGATAVAVIAHHLYGFKSPISVTSRGGEVQVFFEKGGKNIQFQGLAKRIFYGYWPAKRD